jgi:dihydrofolate reductase
MSHPERITLIAAVAQNGVIGADNSLPWRISEDLQRFKALTLGHPIVMGRKTFESLGRPLPGRRNIVVTRSRDYAAPGCVVVGSLDEALEAVTDSENSVFIIGGEDIFRQALPLANCIELTEIKRDFAGNTHFPAVDWADWQEHERTMHVSKDGLAFDFVTYQRR